MTTETTKIEKDYRNYGYKPDAKFVMSGATFNTLMNVLSAIEKDETQVFYSPQDTLEAFMNQQPEVKTTPKGMSVTMLMNDLTNAHIENVDAGNATTFDELSKPQISQA